MNAIASSSSTRAGSSNDRTDLWSEILKSADRSSGTTGRGSWKRKNIILLSERNHGRKHLLEQLASTSGTSTTRKKAGKARNRGLGGPLALGYEALEIREDGDEDSAPPVSIFYPPSSHPTMLKLVPGSLPPKSFQDTAVMIVLDWTKPSSMVKELLLWLNWVDNWGKDAAGRGEAEEIRERLQSHLQHYSEPSPNTPGSSSLPSITSAYGGGPLLPLGPGTLTLNPSGVPIIVVCTRADLMDTVGDEIGMKGGGWEERTDWVQQAIRTVCLAYGAALCYTATSQPSTYSLLRQYLLHRLHTIPLPLNPPSSNTPAPSTVSDRARFPFPHRANVLDRDAVLVPSGWDSWGKINVLREGFDPGRVGKAWEVGLRRYGTDGNDDDDGEEGIEDLWLAMIPDTERGSKTRTTPSITTATEPEQSFLAKQLDILQKDPQRDPRASFRTANAALASSSGTTVSTDLGGGVVGPMGSAGGGLSLPGVEKAMAEMEGGSAEELKEKFARLGMGRRESSRGGGGPLSPPTPGATGSTSAVPNEALHNFFQGLLATKAKSSGTTPTVQSTNTKTSMPPPPVPNRSTSAGYTESR